MRKEASLIEMKEKIADVPATMKKKEYGKPIFTKLHRKTHTVLVPQMLDIHFTIIESVFNYSGYRFELLHKVTDEAIETGLKYVNNDSCYPSIVLIGQLIEAIRSGQYDPDYTAIILPQTCGPCRATNYIPLLRKALDDAGVPQVPILSLSTGDLNTQPGFSITPTLLRRLSLAVLYGDMLQRLYYPTLSHEMFEGDTQELLDKWIKRACTVSCSGSTSAFKGDLEPMVKEFGSLPQDGIIKPKVGILGEIFLKYEEDANKHLIDMIIKEGGEPIPTDLFDFLLYCFYDNIWEYKNMKGSFWRSQGYAWFMRWIESLRKPMRKSLLGSGYFPVAQLGHLREAGSRIVSLGEPAGEGWLLPAEMVDFVQNGISNVLCLQPFGCLPNHVTGRGVIKALREKFPGFNLMALDFEAGTSEAYVANRVKLFMTVAHEELDNSYKERNQSNFYRPSNDDWPSNIYGPEIPRPGQITEMPINIYRSVKGKLYP